MQKAIYTTVGIEELLAHVQALKGVGARFVQMHAERNVDDASYRLVYTFINVRAAQEHIAQDGSYAIENLVVEGIDQYQEIPSISSYYPAVFPFENEAHDLFGLAITDMQIDFKGFFYQVSTAEPMSVITPEVKAAREKAMKVRAAAEAKARKAAAEKAAAAATAGEGAADGSGTADAATAQPAAAAGSDAQHDEAAAKAAGEKNVELIHVKDINAITGYIRGGCTPIGMKKQFPTFIHESAADFDTIIISGGRLGVQLILSPQDLIKVTRGQFADIIMH